MPYSASQKSETPGAVAPVIWYLLNLLALPVIGFLVLLSIAMKSGDDNPIRRAHSKAGVYMSILGAVLISSGVLIAWLIHGNTGSFWTFAIVWAIVLHTSFVLWGMIALAQAIGDKPPYFPRRLL
ncbi:MULTISPECIES: hypothetical protein [Marinobacter]|jgi:uncharacterized membrane protein YciS (DUF1049 family)|uniref:DUF4870 domain-containing protein n=2 Tax=Marinobacter TaxID=2742 RepID=A0A1M2UVI0_MARNT|nr:MULTISPECIES: hypothetical protein [Marinobacter]OJS99359.1 hypothetical protein BEE62_04205 [Marinobacter nauticus]PSF12470.1 hypothetical protein C7H10_09570 [Marinobacter shengliensis]